MWLLSLCGNKKHMSMRHRNEWLAWAATAVGSLGLLGLATAQTTHAGEWSEALAAEGATERVAADDDEARVDEAQVHAPPISDDGWSVELPIARQLVIARSGAQEGPVHIELYNERGEVLEHIEWAGGASKVKPVALDALLAGRYAVRVTRGERAEVVRFRKD